MNDPYPSRRDRPWRTLRERIGYPTRHQLPFIPAQMLVAERYVTFIDNDNMAWEMTVWGQVNLQPYV